MRWLVFGVTAAALIALLPSNRLAAGPRLTLWTLFGFLAVQQGPLRAYFALISWPQWPGYVKGMEVSVLDMLALVFLARTWTARLPFLPFAFATAIYIFVVVISSISAPEPRATLFYAWQLGRVLLVAIAVYRGVATDGLAAPAIFNGMGLAIFVALVGALWDSFVGGRLQTGGIFGHQNTLGMMSHFVSFPALAVVLAGATEPLVFLVAMAGPVAATITVSRATLGIVAVGYALTVLLSLIRRWTGRKMLVAGIGALCVAALLPATIGSFEARIARDQAASSYYDEDERAVFERVAAMMLADHPFGVGANHYVWAAIFDGFADRAGVVPTEGSRSAHVHNAYWLALAETGYLGLMAFLAMLLIPVIQAFRSARRHRRDPRGDLLLGLGLTLVAVYVHSMFEWLLLTFQMQYMLGVTAGLIAGLSYQLNRTPGLRRGRAPDRLMMQEE